MAPQQQRQQLLFVCLPLSGHLNPALAVAAAAAARGAAAVRFAALSRCRAKVEAAGLEFVDLGEPADAAALERSITRAHELKGREGFIEGVRMFCEHGAVMYGPILAAVRGGAAAGTTALVADFTSFAAHDAAETLGLPLVLLQQAPLYMAFMTQGLNDYNLFSHVPLEMPPFVQPERMTLAQRALNPLLKRFIFKSTMGALRPIRLEYRKRLGLPAPADLPLFGPSSSVRTCHVVGGTMDLETERPLPPGWHMSGPQNVDFSGAKFPVSLVEADADGGGAAVRRFLERDQGAGQPVVYIATGSIVEPTKQQVAAIAGAIRSAAAAGVRFIWALPKVVAHLLPEGTQEAVGGEQLLIMDWAPQQAILCHPSVKLFVTHGGLNSTYEGLAAGTPLVVMPFFADQPVNAQHVVNRGLGAQLDPATLTAEGLAAAISSVLADAGAAARAAALGEKLRQRSGADVAAGIIETFVAAEAAAC